MVVEGVCLLVVLIGRLGRRGAGLVGMLNEVPAAFEHELVACTTAQYRRSTYTTAYLVQLLWTPSSRRQKMIARESPVVPTLVTRDGGSRRRVRA